MLKNKVLNIIAYTHILIPHLERKIDQICAGYSWPDNFYHIYRELFDEYSKEYILEKSNKYLGFNFSNIDYDRIYKIHQDNTSFSDKKQSNYIEVKDLESIINYFIEMEKFKYITEETWIEDQTFALYPDGTESEIQDLPFRLHGADPWVTSKAKEYYNCYISHYEWSNDPNKIGKSVKIDNWPQMERDLKLRVILD